VTCSIGDRNYGYGYGMRAARTRSLLASAFLSAFLLCIGATGGAMALHSSIVTIDGARLVPLKFVLLDRPVITKTRGHAHSPFGVRGENSYRYDGRIKVGDRVFKLRTQMQPICAVSLDDKCYLLTRSYFNNQLFEWYEAEKKKFERLPFSSLSLELLNVEFEDSDESLFCKMWVLSCMLETDVEKAYNLISEYTRRNPRFVYQKKWLPRKYTTFSDFVRKLLETKRHFNRTALFNDFEVLLSHSLPQDDPGDVRFVCLLLLDIDPDRAKEVIFNYIERVRKENISDDNRLLDMEPILEIIRKEEEKNKRTG
jgi:hypothetical protein